MDMRVRRWRALSHFGRQRRRRRSAPVADSRAPARPAKAILRRTSDESHRLTADDGAGADRLTGMSKLGGWVGRHRIAAGFAAGALLTLFAVAVVGYLVLADQHRSARVLAAALSQALARDVHIDRVTEVSPSRVVMKGIRLSKERGWPADIVAESVEASGPLLAAARGAAAPIQIQVTRPTISAGGDAAGLAALEGLRQGIADFLASPAVVDVAVTGGVLEAPTAASEAVTFDATLRKGPGSVRGEVLLRDRGQARFGLGLDARPEGDTVRLALSGEGQIAPLAPWLPPAVVRAVGPAPVEPPGPARPRARGSPGGADQQPAGGSRDPRGHGVAPRGSAAPRRAPGGRGSRIRRLGRGADRSRPGAGRAHRRRGLLVAGAGRVAERPRRPARGGGHAASRRGGIRGARAGPRDTADARASRGPRRSAWRASRRPRRSGRRRAGPGVDLVARGPRRRRSRHARGAVGPDGAGARRAGAGDGDAPCPAGADGRPARDDRRAPRSAHAAAGHGLARPVGPASGGKPPRGRDRSRSPRLDRGQGGRGHPGTRAQAARRGDARGSRAGWRDRSGRKCGHHAGGRGGPGRRAAPPGRPPSRGGLGRRRARGRRRRPEAGQSRRA